MPTTLNFLFVACRYGFICQCHDFPVRVTWSWLTSRLMSMLQHSDPINIEFYVENMLASRWPNQCAAAKSKSRELTNTPSALHTVWLVYEWFVKQQQCSALIYGEIYRILLWTYYVTQYAKEQGASSATSNEHSTSFDKATCLWSVQSMWIIRGHTVCINYVYDQRTDDQWSLFSQNIN